MSLKQAITNSLLMFVAATCVVLIVKALPQTPPPQAVASASGDKSGTAATGASLTPTLAEPDGVRVYYLHGNIRCPTCRTIETYAQEAVETAFAEELKSGKVQWQVINYDSPGNERYALDYEVAAPNVVLAMFEDGRQVKWKGLPEVWEYVGDKAAFFAFVQTSLREFLGEPQEAPSLASPPLAPSTPPLAVFPSTATNPIRPPAEPAQPFLPLPEVDSHAERSVGTPLGRETEVDAGNRDRASAGRFGSPFGVPESVR